MSRKDNTKVLWIVQVRKSRAHKWVNKGLFETRDRARHIAYLLRDEVSYDVGVVIQPVGFGNTRVVKYVRAGK